MSAKRLYREWRLVAHDVSPMFAAWPLDGDLHKWEAVIVGPENSPYECGMFSLSITYPELYPFRCPKICFRTPIYHPCVDSKGQIDLGPSLGLWSPAANIKQLLMSIWSLITDFSPDDPVEAHIASQYKHDRGQFDKTAREWTMRYAMQ